MYKKYKGKVGFIGILTQDTKADAERFVARHKLTFPNALDPGDIAQHYKLVGHPAAYFISPDGEVLEKRIGALSEKALEESFRRWFF